MPSNSIQDTLRSGESRLDRSAWVALLVSILLILAGFALPAYCYTLPTDGWQSTSPNDLTTIGYIYQRNLVGLPSALQEGDLLVAVDAAPVDQLGPNSPATNSSRLLGVVADTVQPEQVSLWLRREER
jgi:hypothetical protein